MIVIISRVSLRLDILIQIHMINTKKYYSIYVSRCFLSIEIHKEDSVVSILESIISIVNGELFIVNCFIGVI